MNNGSVSLLLLVALFLVGINCTTKYSLILGASRGPPSEIHIVKAATKNLTDISASLLFCDGAWTGNLFGSRVLLALTGVGAEHSSTCMLNILSSTHFNHVTEIVFLGTSGISPIPNGILHAAPACAVNKRSIPHRIGDVCISTTSVNWGCKFCQWNSSDPSACQFPECGLPTRNCIFSAASASLAQEVLAAVKEPAFSWPRQNETLVKLTNQFWEQMGKATGRSYELPPTPRAVGPTECVEATSWVYWKGMPWEKYCLAITAQALKVQEQQWATNASTVSDEPYAHNGKQHDPHWDPSALKSQAVSCFSAMEGTGWMMVLTHPKVQKLPFVNIRGGSDYDHSPLYRHRGGTWHEMPGWTSKENLQMMNQLGYNYAKQTTSAVVLQLFHTRATNFA
eukprot:TRINITY_DN32767_c0_g1_i1.p1 TRINITY_DN32767_c0_g1~~TRINITY_DN32767_c0_g1_i1.p1  ORF type:complete len:396 (-),score=40.83 TRINITY_DN32767_c0_g1_i1:680-1867(-)